MTRLIAVSLMMVGVILTCLYIQHRVSRSRDTLHAMAAVIFEQIEKEDAEATKNAVKPLVEFWALEQRRLIYFLSHGELDEISRSVARLASYAEYEEYHDLRSELGSILWSIDHMWEKERLTLGRLV